jgi:hypothetical protein
MSMLRYLMFLVSLAVCLVWSAPAAAATMHRTIDKRVRGLSEGTHHIGTVARTIHLVYAHAKGGRVHAISLTGGKKVSAPFDFQASVGADDDVVRVGVKHTKHSRVHKTKNKTGRRLGARKSVSAPTTELEVALVDDGGEVVPVRGGAFFAAFVIIFGGHTYVILIPFELLAPGVPIAPGDPPAQVDDTSSEMWATHGPGHSEAGAPPGLGEALAPLARRRQV